MLMFLFVLGVGIQVHAQQWFSTIADAKDSALEKRLPVVLVFQGSDWCAPCIKLSKRVWETETFLSYAKQHYVLLS